MYIFEHKLHFRPYEISSTIYISIKNVDNLNICWYPLTSIVLFPNMEVNGYQWLFVFQHSSKNLLLCSTEERNSCRFWRSKWRQNDDFFLVNGPFLSRNQLKLSYPSVRNRILHKVRFRSTAWFSIQPWWSTNKVFLLWTNQIRTLHCDWSATGLVAAPSSLLLSTSCSMAASSSRRWLV